MVLEIVMYVRQKKQISCSNNVNCENKDHIYNKVSFTNTSHLSTWFIDTWPNRQKIKCSGILILQMRNLWLTGLKLCAQVNTINNVRAQTYYKTRDVYLLILWYYLSENYLIFLLVMCSRGFLEIKNIYNLAHTWP